MQIPIALFVLLLEFLNGTNTEDKLSVEAERVKTPKLYSVNSKGLLIESNNDENSSENNKIQLAENRALCFKNENCILNRRKFGNARANKLVKFKQQKNANPNKKNVMSQSKMNKNSFFVKKIKQTIDEFFSIQTKKASLLTQKFKKEILQSSKTYQLLKIPHKTLFISEEYQDQTKEISAKALNSVTKAMDIASTILSGLSTMFDNGGKSVTNTATVLMKKLDEYLKFSAKRLKKYLNNDGKQSANSVAKVSATEIKKIVQKYMDEIDILNGLWKECFKNIAAEGKSTLEENAENSIKEIKNDETNLIKNNLMNITEQKVEEIDRFIADSILKLEKIVDTSKDNIEKFSDLANSMFKSIAVSDNKKTTKLDGQLKKLVQDMEITNNKIYLEHLQQIKKLNPVIDRDLRESEMRICHETYTEC